MSSHDKWAGLGAWSIDTHDHPEWSHDVAYGPCALDDTIGPLRPYRSPAPYCPPDLEARTRPRQDHGMTDMVADHIVGVDSTVGPLTRRLHPLFVVPWPTHDYVAAFLLGIVAKGRFS